MSEQPSEPRKVSQPQLPEIEKCPRCGHHVLIGDTRCTNCGYDVQKPIDRIKGQPPAVISTMLFVIGMLIALASTGMENPLQIMMLLLGGGLVISGGLYYALDLLVLNADDRRKPPKK